MSAPAIYNPIIKKGVPFWRTITLTDDAGLPLNLTGATYAGNILNPDRTALATVAFIENANPATGTFQFGVADTSRFPASCVPSLPYDIFVTLAGGVKICPIEGLIQTELTNTVTP